ncbi:endonuclease/exonuclease/phosphatase family protein [Rhodococcus sp. NPDC058505]|uniref:endonuclease/exonuclease/phosphatase family protein n=1 Tax=Rhodococcus sp. NPDC058505 TaxID=3346531 RepID=UPI00365CB1B7
MTPREAVRRICFGGGVGAVAVAALGVLVHYIGPESNTLIIASSFVPVLLAVGVAGVVALAAVRARRTLLAGLLVLLAGIVTQAPLFVRNAPAPAAADGQIRVLQANIRLGEADPDALVDLVRSRRADLLTVEELTDAAVTRLRAAGLEDLLPVTFLKPKESGGGGTGIYSRFPMHDPRMLGRFSMANLVAGIDVGDGRRVTVVAVHPMPPYPSPSWMWAAEMSKLTGLLHRIGGEGDPVIVSGDFNSTYSHSRYRSILTGGFVDAGEQAGAGLVPTYPADRWYPAMLAIDRIVLKDAVVGEYERVDLPGSDHHGIFASVTPEFDGTGFDGTGFDGTGAKR